MFGKSLGVNLSLGLMEVCVCVGVVYMYAHTYENVTSHTANISQACDSRHSADTRYVMLDKKSVMNIACNLWCISASTTCEPRCGPARQWEALF